MDVSIPIIDLGSCRTPVDDPRVAGELDDALRRHGFCYLSGDVIDWPLVEEVLTATREFHNLSPIEKQAVAINPQHRGYIALGSSTTVTSSVTRALSPNQSESFMLMQEVVRSDARWGSAIFGPNQWPDPAPRFFKRRCLRYFEALESFCHQLRQRLAIALGLDASGFDDLFTDPTLFLRLIHYPPATNRIFESAFGSAPHTDHGFLTLVAQDDVGGLEVLLEDHRWIPVKPIPKTLVLNVADMLSHLSGGRWRSTPHRVVASPQSRYSAAFFFDPNFEAQIASRVHGDSLHSGQVFHYGKYLMERFDRNYEYRSQAATPEI